ncbi:MAG: hypothetical protein KatS3mg045_1920 [Bellilinea sp.]|nr:MAG: hypothetical protein KatS3mg045_1920 [Bellilinea sp.]
MMYHINTHKQDSFCLPGMQELAGKIKNAGLRAAILIKPGKGVIELFVPHTDERIILYAAPSMKPIVASESRMCYWGEDRTLEIFPKENKMMVIYTIENHDPVSCFAGIRDFAQKVISLIENKEFLCLV